MTGLASEFEASPTTSTWTFAKNLYVGKDTVRNAVRNAGLELSPEPGAGPPDVVGIHPLPIPLNSDLHGNIYVGLIHIVGLLVHVVSRPVVQGVQVARIGWPDPLLANSLGSQLGLEVRQDGVLWTVALSWVQT